MNIRTIEKAPFGALKYKLIEFMNIRFMNGCFFVFGLFSTPFQAIVKRTHRKLYKKFPCD